MHSNLETNRKKVKLYFLKNGNLKQIISANENSPKRMWWILW